jgi:hypothetical protein
MLRGEFRNASVAASVSEWPGSLGAGVSTRRRGRQDSEQASNDGAAEVDEWIF